MGINGLLEELLDGREVIAERVVTRVRREMPSFEGVPLDEHREDTVAALELIVQVPMDGADPSLGDTAEMLRELGERRARQGVPVDDLLRSWRIGIEEATTYAREVAPRTDVSPDEVFDLFQQAFGLADQAMVSMAGGHRLEPDPAGPEAERRATLVQGALLERLDPGRLHSGFAALALDPLVPYRAFRARSGDEADADRLNAALESDGEGGRDGLAAVLEEELAGFTSIELPRGELDLVALGPLRLPTELAASYETAGRVLAAAESFGLVGMHDLASAGLLAAVIEDRDLGAALAEQLVAPVAELPGGAEVLASVREWLAAGMRVDPAAERLFVHPNTVRYRMKRYQALTGADLHETEDILRVWWAMQRERALDGVDTAEAEAGPAS